ncbi:hypothetical protein C9374_002955 [Naegleria lovaniensis]|uniref:Beta-lactamase-related domain-containing protein n=1 Tax=Naegleria lovaniensis TaxID=51637 RepID=A0AA88GU19_NAELO|nr:uncharacterized protein C9374_002955 [Naegleria lovaniensis]KAG2385806.1 hypothetical protein C9374_002955 [Naegleria lovaniensis]
MQDNSHEERTSLLSAVAGTGHHHHEENHTTGRKAPPSSLLMNEQQQQQPGTTTTATAQESSDLAEQAPTELNAYERGEAGSVGQWKDSCSLPFFFSIFLIAIPLLWFLLVFQNVYMNPFNYSPDFEWIYNQAQPVNMSSTFQTAAIGRMNRTEFSNEFIEKNVLDHFPKLLKKYGVAGAQLVLIDQAENPSVDDQDANSWRLRELAFGQRDIYFQVNDTVDNFTLFQVAELGETVTAFGIMKLLMDGRINSIVDSVNAYLKSFKILDLAGNLHNGTNIKELLQHTSGCRSLDKVRQNIRVDTSKVGAVSLSRQSIGADYAVLQTLIEDVTGQNFTKWINENILNPLGMILSTYDTNDISNDRIFSSSYGSYFYAIPEMGYSVISSFGLYSRAREYANLVIAGLNADKSGNAVLDQRHTKSIFDGDKYIDGFKYTTATGYGVLVETLSDGSLTAFKTGLNVGWKAQYGFNSVHKQGYVLFTNTEAAEPVLDVFHCYWQYQMTGSNENNACVRVADRQMGDLIVSIITWIFAVALLIFWAIMTAVICHPKFPITCNFPFLSGNWLDRATSFSVVSRFIIVVFIAIIYAALMIFLHSDVFGLVRYSVHYVIFAVRYAPFYLPFSSLVFGFYCMTCICIAVFVYRSEEQNSKKIKDYERINY